MSNTIPNFNTSSCAVRKVSNTTPIFNTSSRAVNACIKQGIKSPTHPRSSLLQSPGEIKRRKVSWTLTKKLDTFAGPGEIKRREVSWTLTKKLDTFAGPSEIKRREVMLDLQWS